MVTQSVMQLKKHAGDKNERPVSDNEKGLCLAVGKRLAETAKRLKSS